MNAEERLLGRFKAEFDNKRLANVKFFVDSDRISVTDLYEQLNLFEDTVSAGDFKEIESIDADFPTTRFDAPFE